MLGTRVPLCVFFFIDSGEFPSFRDELTANGWSERAGESEEERCTYEAAGANCNRRIDRSLENVQD